MSGQESAVRSVKNTLAGNLQLQARLLLFKDSKEKALAALAESVALAEQETNTLDLGLLYTGMNKLEEAIPLLAKAYSFEGNKKQEARAALERVYGEREKSVALATLLKDAVDARKKAREAERAATMPGSVVSKLLGQPAPVWDLPTATGQRVQLASLQGKVVLLNFWATW
jgi:tetratricopeptide (TPR) repeat protein